MARRVLVVAAALAAASALRRQETLRVLTYNVHAWRDSDHEDSFERVAKTCAAADADVVCLNEVLHPYDGGQQPQSYFDAVARREGVGLKVVECAPKDSYLQRLAEALKMPHLCFVEAERDGCFFGKAAFGNAILSKRPFVDAGHAVARPEPGDDTLGDQARGSVEARAMVWAAVEVGDERVGVAAAHLDHKAEPLREKQLKRFLDELRVNGPALHLICGDLNTFCKSDHDAAAWAAILAFYDKRGWGAPAEASATLDAARDLGYADAGAGRTLEATCWTHNPLFRIDHVLLNDGLRRRCDVLDYRRIDSDASDHYPVVVDLGINFS